MLRKWLVVGAFGVVCSFGGERLDTVNIVNEHAVQASDWTSASTSNTTDYYNRDWIHTNQSGAQIVFHFFGTRISLYGNKKDSRGTFRVQLDGGTFEEYSAYVNISDEQHKKSDSLLYQSETLENKKHTLVIEKTNDGKTNVFDYFVVKSDWVDTLDVFLMIGQSNMAGRGDIENEDKGPIENVFLLNQDSYWEVASQENYGFNRYSTIRKDLSMQGLNMGKSFSETLLDSLPNLKVGLVCNARGGSKIEEWAKTTNYFRDIVQRVRSAQSKYPLRLKGILWHQGESNSGNPSSHGSKLVQLVQDLRDSLGVPGLPFIYGEIFHKSSNFEMNDTLQNIASRIPHSKFVLADGLTDSGDNIHFGSEAQRTLGERYANAIFSFLVKKDSTVVIPNPGASVLKNTYQRNEENRKYYDVLGKTYQSILERKVYIQK